MKKPRSVIWGVVLIAAGVLFALNALDITSIDIFFDGGVGEVNLNFEE